MRQQIPLQLLIGFGQCSLKVLKATSIYFMHYISGYYIPGTGIPCVSQTHKQQMRISSVQTDIICSRCLLKTEPYQQWRATNLINRGKTAS